MAIDKVSDSATASSFSECQKEMIIQTGMRPGSYNYWNNSAASTHNINHIPKEFIESNVMCPRSFNPYGNS